MTHEQETNYIEYLETVWRTCLKRAGRKTGGSFDTECDAWNLYENNGKGPVLSFQVDVQNILPMSSPLEAVARLNRFAGELQKEIANAMAAGKFNARVIAPGEHLEEMAACRNA